ncbi:MAG: hypothetical protein RL645_989 [Actinomycetota bacterium]|jgi:hypothetical protein
MLKIVIALGLSATLSIAGIVLPAEAVVAKKYANCTALKKDYPGGVALAAGWKNKGGSLKNTPVVNAKVYKLNAAKDRDGDKLACES